MSASSPHRIASSAVNVYIDGAGSGQRSRAKRTGIELCASGLQRSAVVDADLVALLCLPLALDGRRDVDLELCIGGKDTHGSRGEERQGQEDGLHCDGWRIDSKIRLFVGREVQLANKTARKWDVGGRSRGEDGVVELLVSC